MYTGHAHWITTVACDTTGLQLFDSLAGSKLSACLEQQIARVYGRAESETIVVSRRPVQQQDGRIDCGLFAIANAYHAAWGDVVEMMCFDQSAMRKHLAQCFERQQLSPFPAADCKQRKCRTKHFVVTMYCYCRMPSSFDDNMIKCDNCSKWFHCRCAEVPPLSSPDTWHCCVTCS